MKSEPVEKDPALVFETDKALGDRRNMLYSGTIVNYGRGEFVVTETGMQTELGHIATLIQGVQQEQTPLQIRLDKLGKWLAGAALILVAVIFVLGLVQGQSNIQELLLTAVSLAVAAVPEALTAVVTIALSLGAQRMLKRNALIRKLPAVETLGSVTIICSDKTGTLTLNRMTVTALDIANHSFELTQATDETDFELVPTSSIPSPGAQPTLDLLLIAGALDNDASLSHDENRPGRYQAVGDPTEGALVVAAAYAGIKKDDLEAAFPRVAEVPFELGTQADDDGSPDATVHRRIAAEPGAYLGATRQPNGDAAVRRLYQGRYRRHAWHLQPGVGGRRAAPVGR